MKLFNIGHEIIMEGYGHTDRIETLKELWTPTFDAEKGKCFTFDPYKSNTTLIKNKWMKIRFLHTLYPDHENRPPLKYYVVIHDTFEDRFDAYVRNPSLIIYGGWKHTLKISKTVMETLNRESDPCFEEQLYGFEKCKYLKGGMRFIEKHNCTLPWMNHFEFGDFTLCESDSVPNMDLYDLIQESLQVNENAECENYLACKRSIYEDRLEQELIAQPIDKRKSELIIRYSSPYIQVIKDSWGYDMQSYIGEVGGTLGLLLGLSFASIFDLFEYLLIKFFKF